MNMSLQLILTFFLTPLYAVVDPDERLPASRLVETISSVEKIAHL